MKLLPACHDRCGFVLVRVWCWPWPIVIRIRERGFAKAGLERPSRGMSERYLFRRVLQVHFISSYVFFTSIMIYRDNSDRDHWVSCGRATSFTALTPALSLSRAAGIPWSPFGISSTLFGCDVGQSQWFQTRNGIDIAAP